jgi:hypothetical protein
LAISSKRSASVLAIRPKRLAHFQAETAKMVVAASCHFLLDVAEFGPNSSSRNSGLVMAKQQQAEHPVPLEIGAFGLISDVIDASRGIAE